MISEIIKKAIEYDRGDPKRIAHFMKVYAFSKTIGELEQLDIGTQNILEISAVLHDIGIHNCEIKFNSSAGNLQEEEGPPVAKAILDKLNVPDSIIDRVCWLIAHHHTYSAIYGTDYQILVEADFLVNILEDNMNENKIKSIRSKIFKTKTGLNFIDKMYLNI